MIGIQVRDNTRDFLGEETEIEFQYNRNQSTIISLTKDELRNLIQQATGYLGEDS